MTPTVNAPFYIPQSPNLQSSSLPIPIPQYLISQSQIRNPQSQIPFLGFHLTATAISLAAQTLRRFWQRFARLYEQDAGDLWSRIIGQYVRHWWRWLKATAPASFAGVVATGPAIFILGRATPPA